MRCLAYYDELVLSARRQTKARDLPRWNWQRPTLSQRRITHETNSRCDCHRFGNHWRATALALGHAGIKRVTLVEKGPLVSGMTRRNAGLVHPFQPHPLLVELASRELRVL